MAFVNQKNMYLKTQIETASKEQLVVMLFDGIIRFTEQARKAILAGTVEESHHFLVRAQAIIMELICTVDKEKGGEVARNLLGLHAYAFNCLVLCNIKKDVAKIDEVQNIYRQLREGWIGAMESLGIGARTMSTDGQPSHPAKPAPVRNPIPPSQTASPVLKPQERIAGPEIRNPEPRMLSKTLGAYGPGRTSTFTPSPANSAFADSKDAEVPAAGIIAAPGLARYNAVLGAYAVGARNVS
ncbi:MAG: flagellar export chaperone FliS [Planctomycetota bacterium]|jgi:flagellar protein FliS|nr:flagellar export chaperone FliS [Planctomycetota bacterium]